MSITTSRARRALVRIAVVALVAATALAALASGALAGKTSMSVSVADGTFAGSTTARVSGNEAARGGTSASVVYRVEARCYQGGSLVYREYKTVQSDGTAGPFTLGPTPLWQGGDADCTADLGYFRSNGQWRSAAVTSFHVSA